MESYGNRQKFPWEKGDFWKLLGRIVFLIMVTWEELRISINRRATPSKVDSFQFRNSLSLNLDP
jgi:hypothetical protein